MENTTIVNNLDPALKRASSAQIEKITQLIDAYNFDQAQVILYLLGDKKSGISFRLECEQRSTKIRLENVLKQFFVSES